MESLPTPPSEDILKSQGPKRQHSHSKAVKAVHRVSKRASTHGHPASPATTDSHSHTSSSADGRHKRVWKACERCRMKKTKVCLGCFCILENHQLTRWAVRRRVPLQEV